MRAAVLTSLLLLSGCNDRTVPPPAAAGVSSSPGNADSEWFTDRAKETGLDFVHVNGMSGRFYHARNHGARRRPVRLRQRRRSRRVPRSGTDARGQETRQAQDVAAVPLRGPAVPERSGRSRRRHADAAVHRRHRRERHRRARLRHGRRGGRHRQRRLRRSVPHELRRANQLFRNNCDGTFTDVSQTERHGRPGLERVGGVRGLRPRRLARSLRRASTCDYSSTATRRCFSAVGRARLLHAADAMRRCRTACTATSTTARSPTSAPGPASPREFGPALGVATADFNGDGWMDIYVANDGQDNQLWINQRDGTFKNTALLSGVALTGGRQGRGEHGRRRRRLRQRRRRRPVHDRTDGRRRQPLRQRRDRDVRRPQHALGPRPRHARRTPDSARPGSTSTTTAGWTS